MMLSMPRARINPHGSACWDEAIQHRLTFPAPMVKSGILDDVVDSAPARAPAQGPAQGPARGMMSKRMAMSRLAFALACLALPLATSLAWTPALAQDRSLGHSLDRSLARDLNSFGIPGMIDMPTAFGRPDGELAMTASHFRNQTRMSLTFQISPRLSASFRYALLYDVRPYIDSEIWDFRFDRSFSLQYRLLDEGRYRPAVAVGLNDLVGTGIYAGEYLVASKTLSPRLRASLGIGWGRLGSYGGFSNPLGVFGDSFRTRPIRTDGLGGNFEPGLWFKGDAAFFGGIEWQVNDRLRLIAEYSSDDYAREDGAAFTHRSPLNLGLSYQYSDRTTLSARYLYGSELGVQLTYALNPKRPRFGSGLEGAPPPVIRREDLGRGSAGQDPGSLEAATARALAQQGVGLDGLERAGKTLRLQIRNDRYAMSAQALGRAARVLSRTAPPEVETFVIRLAAKGMPVTSVVLRRSDIEDLEFHPVAPDLLRASTRIMDTTERLPAAEGRFPILSWGLEPYLTPSLFDPDDPLRLDIGAALVGRYEPMPGLIFSGRLHQKLLGNLDNATRASTSVLPRVRSEAYLYARNDGPTIPELTGAWYFRPGENLFGRVTVGYLESMFGGVSTELLWKPQNSRLALGAELNYARQRDFDQLFGFRPYDVITGHVSAYYDLGRGYQGQLDVGRYLAGDLGATLTLAREFENGWRIGAFATKTDVSAADFGEGSFDKGILLTVPLDWVTGRPSQTRVNTVIRPVQRDGGARLAVQGRLYETVRGLQSSELDATWGRFWR